ncbi:SDR family NAD(P)-dependent oxidoreductase [Mesorhizobium sp. ANAO-SY3R2]|uniref:SDR family NAD(P)-dependent oxidoreductase n=1 Tax=Mesorhizobium sp. ANAO-SY3R2 TaxID=3166644 RepID=UPI00366F9D44
MSDEMMGRYPSLKDRPVLISGGATGIGEALVRAFAGQGARVGFVDLAEAEGTALADELNAAGGTVAFRACDITDIEAYRAAIAAIEALHGPTLALVNNAANDTRHDWRDVTPDYFDGRVAVNLRHAFFAIQATAPGMIAAGRGSIVNFGSIGWMKASGGYPVYAASKAAVHGMTRSFARDLGKHGIRVNTLVPGWVMTKRQLDLWVDDAANAEIDKAQCLSGRVMPDDIARMALFLAADDSRMCTAQNFVVDGGWV